MEKDKLSSIPITKKQKAVYKKISWRKGKVLESFRRKYGEEIESYRNVHLQVREVPKSLIDKDIVVAKKEKKEVIEAFMGYIALKLIYSGGDVNKTVKEIKEDLNLV